MNHPEIYQIFAVHYGTHSQRYRRDNFIATDDHDSLMPLNYYVWAIVNENRTIVVDTGFDHKEGKRRGRELLRLPREGLAMLGIDCQRVEDVIVSHLHYDHAGTLDDFPNASFHLQDLEMNYATGRHMCHTPFRYPYTVDHVIAMVKRLYAGKVVFHEGDGEIAPGITVHHVGGHTMGLQCVRIHTQRGWVVLASDASHFYENMERGAPFPLVYSVGDMVQGYQKMKRLAASDQHIIPGHDPLVMERYPAPNQELAGTIVRLDVDPMA